MHTFRPRNCCGPDRETIVFILDPDIPILRPVRRLVLLVLPHAHAHRLPNIERRQVPVVYLLYAGAFADLRSQHRKHQDEGERAVDQQVAMPFLLATVLRVKVDGVGIVGQRAEMKKERWSRREAYREIRRFGGWNFRVSSNA